MKKRILSILLAFAMIFTLMPTAFAVATTTYQVVTVDKTTVKQGETVNVKVTLPNISETAGSFTVVMNFDKNKFEVTDRKMPPTLTATNTEFGNTENVSIVANGKANANTNGQLTANAAYVYNTIQVAGVTVVDATLKAKTNVSGEAAFSFETFEITYSDNGTQYIVKKDQLETPPSVTILKAPITSVSATVSQPVKGHPLDTSVNVYGATAYTADVIWKDVEENMTATGNAKPGKIYTALITLKAKEGEAFSSSLKNTTTPGGYTIEWLNSTELLLSKTFDRTNVKETTGITIDNTTLTVAVPKAEPNMEQKAELPLTAKVNYDDGTNETADVTWSIVTKPEGVDIEEDGKLTVTNKAAGGTVEVKAALNGMTDTETVTITKDTLNPSAIVATAPTEGTNIIIPNGGTNTSGNCSYKYRCDMEDGTRNRYGRDAYRLQRQHFRE